MQMLIIALVLQTTTPAAVDPAQQAPPAHSEASGSTTPADCHYDRVRHQRICVNEAGEELRCRRERILGSRLPITLCTTAAEDAAMERDSRDAIEKYQNITTPDVG